MRRLIRAFAGDRADCSLDAAHVVFGERWWAAVPHISGITILVKLVKIFPPHTYALHHMNSIDFKILHNLHHGLKIKSIQKSPDSKNLKNLSWSRPYLSRWGRCRLPVAISQRFGFGGGLTYSLILAGMRVTCFGF